MGDAARRCPPIGCAGGQGPGPGGRRDTARPGLRDVAGGGRGQTPQGGVGLPQETPPVSVRRGAGAHTGHGFGPVTVEFPFKVILNVQRISGGGKIPRSTRYFPPLCSRTVSKTQLCSGNPQGGRLCTPAAFSPMC